MDLDWNATVPYGIGDSLFFTSEQAAEGNQITITILTPIRLEKNKAQLVLVSKGPFGYS